MSDTLKQYQTAGDHSTNVQGQQVTIYGISVAEARQIALDVFKANALELAEIGRDLFESRGREFIDNYLAELQKRKPEALGSFKDPDMQVALFTAQREYARSGDRDLSDLLVDILVDRAALGERKLRQIVLNESLSVAPKLTAGQFDVLSLIFLLRYTRNGRLGNLEELKEYLDKTILPFAGAIPEGDAPYQHLEYTGSASIQISAFGIGDSFLKSYPGLFCKGFSKEQFSSVSDPTPHIGNLLIPSLHNQHLLQVAALNKQVLEELCNKHGIDAKKAGSLQQSHLMSSKEVEGYLAGLSEDISNVLAAWKTAHLNRMTLTSVGIAIAHANIRRKIHEEFDLGIWIP